RGGSRSRTFVLKPCLFPRGRQIEGILLCRDVFVRDLQPALEATQLRIDLTDIPQEHHEHVTTVFLGSSHICRCRLDAAADSAKNVQLPRRSQVALEIVELDRSDLD